MFCWWVPAAVNMLWPGNLRSLQSSRSCWSHPVTPAQHGSGGTFLWAWMISISCCGWRGVRALELLDGERDENEVRKSFTVSERVALKRAIEARIGDRRRFNADGGPIVETSPQSNDVEPGEKTRDYAATRAGFDSEWTARQAQAVVERGEASQDRAGRDFSGRPELGCTPCVSSALTTRPAATSCCSSGRPRRGAPRSL